MKVPNADSAVVDIRKLRDYCLNPEHREGKYKAHLFATILGITVNDAEALRDILLEMIKTHDAQLGRSDAYGQRYTVDSLLEWRGRRAMVRSGFVARIKMRCCGRSDVICFFCNEKEIHVPHPQLERV